MFWLRNKKNNFQLRTFLWGPAECYSHILFKTIFKQNIGCCTLNSSLAHLLITFANSSDPGQDRHTAGPDLDPNRWQSDGVHEKKSFETSVDDNPEKHVQIHSMQSVMEVEEIVGF